MHGFHTFLALSFITSSPKSDNPWGANSATPGHDMIANALQQAPFLHPFLGEFDYRLQDTVESLVS